MAYNQNRRASTQANGKYPQKKNGGFSHLLLFYILPFLVFNVVLFFIVTSSPKAELDLADTNDYLTTEATLTIKSLYPTRSVRVSMDGEALEIEKGKGRTYTIPIKKNGLLEASIVNLNGMSTTVYEHVSILDDNQPTIENPQVEDGILTLTVTDSQSGVDFDSVHALDSEGKPVNPITADPDTCTFTYPMDSDGLTVYAKDKAGYEVRGTFTSHKEGGVESLESNISGEEEDVETTVDVNGTNQSGSGAANESGSHSTTAANRESSGSRATTAANKESSGSRNTTAADGEVDIRIE